MITDNEKFIEIQAILASSNINTRDCAKINDLIIELSKENQKYKEVIDRAIKRLEKGIFIIPNDTNELLDILKKVKENENNK